jgi:hypothetical protein
VTDTAERMFHIKFKKSVLFVNEHINTHLNDYSLLNVEFVGSKSYNQFIARNMDYVKCLRHLLS